MTTADSSATRTETSAESPFRVPLILHILGDVVHRHPSFWIRLGQLESSMLTEELARVPIRTPIYVCGLARSGSTLLHEVVADHPGVATHRSKDFPMAFTPYWWRKATAGLPTAPPRERLHADGVMVTAQSPDAVEEMVWMAFFPNSHRPAMSAVLGAETHHPVFERFYDAHLRKLMLAEKATRYAAKDNYHIARLAYLTHLYPDAKILLPIRSPADHIASLLRQQRLFSAGQKEYPRALAYMRRSGHFEFGLDRRPINLGDEERVRQIQETLACGDEVRGLAMYWNMVYSYLWRLLESDSIVRRACRIVRFEDIATDPDTTLRAALQHCELPDADAVANRHASRIRKPTSDRSIFSPQELTMIHKQTATTAALWGYN